MRFFLTAVLLSTAALVIIFFPSEKERLSPANISQLYEKSHPLMRAIQRADHEFMKSRDPRLNALPDNLSSRLSEFSAHVSVENNKKGLRSNSIMAGAQWVNRGPVNVGGRIKVLKFDVRNTDIIMAGSASGGLWRSIDGGQSWAKMTGPAQEQSITALAQDTRPGMEDTWYLGTGEMLSTIDRSVELFARSIGMGNGIYKSTDNGLTWSRLESTAGGKKGSLTEPFQGVWKIITAPASEDKDVVYAACYGAIMRSEDGGESWQAVLGDLENKCFSTDIEITPEGTLYAALTSFSLNGGGNSETGIYRSDDGIKWDKISGEGFVKDTRRIKLAAAPSNESILYVFTEYPQYPQSALSAFTQSIHSFWKFEYDSQSAEWAMEDRTQNIPDTGSSSFNQKGLGTIGGYCMVLEVSPDDEDNVIMGGVWLWNSTDAFANTQLLGVNSHQMSLGSSNPSKHLHADVHWLEFKPGDESELYVGCDGGAQKTSDWKKPAVEWESLNNGLITTQFYSVSLDKGKKTKMDLMGGLQDNNTWLTTSENPEHPWVNVGFGDGIDCEIVDEGFLIASAQNGFIFFMTDTSFNLLNAFDFRPQGIGQKPKLFYTFFEVCPVDHNYVFFPVGNEIYRQSEALRCVKDTLYAQAGGGWEQLENLTIPVQGEYYTAISASTEPADVLYLGTSLGRVFRVDNSKEENPVMTDITGAGFPNGAYLACLETDPGNADNVFAVFSNYNVKSLFFSSDGGLTWDEVGGNLEDDPDAPGIAPSFRWLSFMPLSETENIYFLGTSIGLFSTREIAGKNTEWVQESPEMIGNVLIDNIDIRPLDGTAAIATQGNGIYTAQFSPLTSAESPDYRQFAVGFISPNPVKTNADLMIHLPFAQNVSFEIFDYAGRKVLEKNYGRLSAGENKPGIPCGTLSPGAYILRVNTESGMKSQKFVKE